MKEMNGEKVFAMNEEINNLQANLTTLGKRL